MVVLVDLAFCFLIMQVWIVVLIVSLINLTHVRFSCPRSTKTCLLISYHLPWNLWLILAAFAGIAGGLATERLTAQKGSV